MPTRQPAPAVVVWHRRDLRLADNPLYADLDGTRTLVALYCVDDDDFSRRPSAVGPWEVARVGPFAARFLVESLRALRGALRSRGSDLVVRWGQPHVVLPRLVQEMAAADPDGVGSRGVEVRFAADAAPGTSERQSEERVMGVLQAWPCRGQVRGIPTSTLFHPDDLPTSADDWRRLAHPNQKHRPKRRGRPKRDGGRAGEGKSGKVKDTSVPAYSTPSHLKGAPAVMGEWRRAARSANPIRAPVPAPAALPPTPKWLERGEIPKYSALMAPVLGSSGRTDSLFGLAPEMIVATVQAAAEDASADPRSAHDLVGGEAAAFEQLMTFLARGGGKVEDRAAAGVGNNGSAKLSAYLAFGCISAREVYAASAEVEGADWLCSHLEIRDYFLYRHASQGAAIFARLPPGAAKTEITWRDDLCRKGSEGAMLWARWASGSTGLPLVDASMRELWMTGYTSNRCRQNDASVLAKDLCIDWRAGAELMQWLLVDHDVASNWGNWAYFSGAGADPKNRHFRTVSQALKYDAGASFIRTWIPELQGCTVAQAIWPFGSSNIGGVEGWLKPVVDPWTQLTWQDAERARHNPDDWICMQSGDAS